MSAADRRPLPPAPGLQIFDEAECRRRLQEGGVGRLAMRGEEAPEIRPVNFALRDAQVIVRTGDGSILEAARRAEPAAFEIDTIDRLEHTGWSVVVQGRLSELPTNHENLDLTLRAWASGQKNCFIGLSLDRVTGMRIPPGRGNR